MLDSKKAPVGEGLIAAKFYRDPVLTGQLFQDGKDGQLASRVYPGGGVPDVHTIRPGQLIIGKRHTNTGPWVPRGDSNQMGVGVVSGLNFSASASHDGMLSEYYVIGISLAGINTTFQADGSNGSTQSGAAAAAYGKSIFTNGDTETLYPGDFAMFDFPDTPFTKKDYVIPSKNPKAAKDAPPEQYEPIIVRADPSRVKGTLNDVHALLTSPFIKKSETRYGGFSSGVRSVTYTQHLNHSASSKNPYSRHQQKAMAYKIGLVQPLLVGLWTLASEGALVQKGGGESNTDYAKRLMRETVKRMGGIFDKADLDAEAVAGGGAALAADIPDTLLQKYFDRVFLLHASFAGAGRQQALADFNTLFGKTAQNVAKSTSLSDTALGVARMDAIVAHIVATGAEQHAKGIRMSEQQWRDRILGKVQTVTPPNAKGTIVLGYGTCY